MLLTICIRAHFPVENDGVFTSFKDWGSDMKQYRTVTIMLMKGMVCCAVF